MKTKTRGVEPIVAAVLLIVVAAVGAVLIYLWFAGYVTATISQVEQMTASERIKVEAANLTSTRASIYIRNIGGNNVTLATAYILRQGSLDPVCTNSSAIEIYRGTTTATGRVSTLFPGRVHLVRFGTAGCRIVAGHDYVIKVVTQRGTELAVTVTAS